MAAYGDHQAVSFGEAAAFHAAHPKRPTAHWIPWLSSCDGSDATLGKVSSRDLYRVVDLKIGNWAHSQKGGPEL